jgi:2'-5' RNA ligase
METIVSNIPGYRLYEYLLVLNPHEELRNRILQLKKEFFETYKGNAAVNSKPYVGLVRFTQYQMMEERILHRLKLIAMSFPPFKVELKDFGSFPAHTIYINVVSKIPIQNLVKEIRSETQRLMKLNDDHKPHFMTDSYITIARKLQPWQYEKGWLEYTQKHFTGRFIADAMLLLKRPLGEKVYQIAERLQFQNLPVSTRQGDLFM